MADWDDPEVVACNGPTLRDLQDASIGLMLEPYREQLRDLTVQMARHPRFWTVLAEVMGIVQDLVAAKSDVEVAGVQARAREFCSQLEGTDHG